MASKYTFHHPTLGAITGIQRPETPDVVEFRAIPYATLPGRFKHSILREHLTGTSTDFSQQGYAAPHNFSADDVNSGGPYPGAEPIETDEFKSLVLNVNIPVKHANASARGTEKLPILTYIHGGGFVLGKIDAQHNTAHMAQHSLTISQPVVTVSLQYRLGALGFMATPDGGKNFALQDQRNALLWIQKFIEGFGGDSKRHTVFGESAGGWSICCHMLSHAPASGPLFNRAVIMSGVVVPLGGPQAQDKAEEAFGALCEDLGIKDTGDAALSKLRTLDVQSLVDASERWTSKGNSWMPVADDGWFREKVVWDKVPELLGRCEWVDDIVIGTTGFEGQMNLSVANLLTPETWLEYVKVELSDAAAEKVMRAYEIAVDMDQNLFLTRAMRWMGDLTFDGMLIVSVFLKVVADVNSCHACFLSAPQRPH
jgi:carboxylesterase type B